MQSTRKAIPESLRQTINRTAHTLAQTSFASIRGGLETEALSLISAGLPVDRVEEEIRRRADGQSTTRNG